MLRNYLTVTLRNLRRDVLHSAIVLLSLSLGIASCVIIFLFVRDEVRFDSFHSKNENIYRLVERQKTSNGGFSEVGLSGPPFGPGMQTEFPEIASYTRVEEWGRQPMRVGDQQLLPDDQLMWVDSTFFEIFDFPLLYGDRSTLLDEPNNLVVTRSTALKFFNHTSIALGKQVIIGNRKDPFVITGIVEDLPEYSHLQFGGLISMSTYTRSHPEYNTDWTGNNLVTYFQLHANTDVARVESKFPAWLIKWTGSKDINDGFGIYLQNLKDIHLESTAIEHDYINHRKFSSQYLNIITVIGLLILVIASINFMNLTTTRSSYRWKEIGVRKSIGAQRIQLLRQFIVESVMLTIMSLVIAFFIDLAFIPLLNSWIGRDLELADLNLKEILLMIASAITLGVLTAFYPAVIMSSVRAINALKGQNKFNGTPVFQSILVIVQFALAIGFIVGTLVVSRQINFMKNEDLGFSKERIILVSMNDQANDKFEILKSEIQKISSVTGVTASSQRMGNNFHQTVFSAKNGKETNSVFTSNLNVDYDYFQVYNIPIKEGRSFSRNFSSDKGKAFIINQAMMKELLLTDAIGTPAGYNNEPNGTIVGVVDDFKYNSLHHKVSALSISCYSDWNFAEMSVKIKGDSERQAIESIRSVWSKIITDHPFDYYFLEDHFENLYKNDTQLDAAVSILTIVSILISCMGLFGLAALITIRRTKEIGIRKILGASEIQIVGLLSRNFVMLIVIAFVAVVPISYFVTSSWLQNFAYRITIDPLLFILGGILALGIGFFTISYHTVKTARVNPVKSLKHE